MPYKTKEAQHERNQRYLAAHREENKARCKASYEAHKEERKQKMRERHAAHREEENAKRREWTRTHPEESAASKRAYYATHKEERAVYREQYARTHAEQLKKAAREYARTHRLQIYQNRKRMTDKLRAEVLTHYGNGKLACVRCGYGNIDALALDHINGNGAEHRRSVGRAGYSFYALLKRQGYPAGFQTMCSNCNTIKVKENNEHKSKYADQLKEQQDGKGN